MLASQFDLFLFDLDGVVYVGSDPLPEAVSSLKRLRHAGKNIRFLTNDPCATRESVCERLHKIGVEVEVEEMITSSFATARYLQKEGIQSVYVLSDEHLIDECERLGIQTSAGENVEAVAIGWGGDITLQEVQHAARLISNGAKFIGTGPDLSFPTKKGPMLATGSLIEMIARGTGVKPTIVGKPYPLMFETALEQFPNIEKERVVMIGDNPSTDILGAHQIGISSLLISDAVDKPFAGEHDFRNPDAIMPNLKSLFKPEVRFKPWTQPAFLWPEAIKAAVTAVLFDEEGQVLLMRRRDNGLWGLPTGHVEPGESVTDAIRREVLEETGLEIEVTRLIGVYSDPNTQIMNYPDGRIVHFVTSCFECKQVGGALADETAESLEVRFFKPDQLPDDMLAMHSNRIEDARQDHVLIR